MHTGAESAAGHQCQLSGTFPPNAVYVRTFPRCRADAPPSNLY
jgi:hypothetical protein